MKWALFLIGISIAVFVGCSNQDNKNPITPIENNGKILFKIDKANAPIGVVVVEAILSREGFETITAALNMLSDSTADILIDNIAVGLWHLEVDAKDSTGELLYSGETDVEILAGFITQVNLTLYPTGEGTGSIYIFVTWGTQVSSNWIDHLNNPVLTSSNNYYDLRGVAQPVVFLIDGLYKMWYYGEEGAGVKYVLYAESNDGISWQRPINEPVLSPGPSGSWDSWAVHPGAIIKDGELFKMYYPGWADTYGRWDIGLAFSNDGINWEKFPTPVLYGTSGWEFQIHASSIIKHNDLYYLYYTGRNLPELKIGLATSADGINWTRYSGNPILTNTESWEESGVYYPTVIKENDQFKMIYMNSNGTGFGMAYSSDGINWTKDNSNPFFTNENTSNSWAANKIAYPNIIKLLGEYRVYYSGIQDWDGFFRIGFARKFGE